MQHLRTVIAPINRTLLASCKRIGLIDYFFLIDVVGLIPGRFATKQANHLMGSITPQSSVEVTLWDSMDSAPLYSSKSCLSAESIESHSRKKETNERQLFTFKKLCSPCLSTVNQLLPPFENVPADSPSFHREISAKAKKTKEQRWSGKRDLLLILKQQPSQIPFPFRL